MGNRLAVSSITLTPVATSVGVITVGEAVIAFGGGGGRGSEAACSTISLNSSDGPIWVELSELSPSGAVTDEVITAGVAVCKGCGGCGDSLLPVSTLSSAPVSGLII